MSGRFIRKRQQRLHAWWRTTFVHRWWSWQNWRKGYRFGPIQRCRWCDHTSPYHYPTCRRAAPAVRPEESL